MAKRKLRIVKNDGNSALGVCECCNAQFGSNGAFTGDPIEEIRELFGNHICEPMDSSQNALQIVHEATKNKQRAKRHQYRRISSN
jgi:hypothetical protein